jgi:glycosyltransferase involved in cell wall biosynthesis
VTAAPRPKVTFITNFASHYRSRTFELIAERHDAWFYFFSKGGEANWLAEHGVSSGRFPYRYLSGFSIAGIRIAPRLIPLAFRDESDVVIKCINGKFALAVVASACLLRRRPFIVWTGDWSVLDSRFARLFDRVNHLVYKHADAIVTYGEHVTRYLVEQGIPPEKIFTSKHAVTNEIYSRPVPAGETELLRRALAIPRDAKIVLSLGRLVPIKGLAYLIRAFAAADSARDAYLVIAGVGPERAACEELIRQLGIEDRVRFPGYVKPAASVAYYAAANVFVLPSLTRNGWKETWGLVVNEAFNQGVPVITTDAVGAAAGGLVVDGENGFVVPERNAAAIASALDLILTGAGLRRRLSANARRRIAGWGQKDMVEAFADAIDYVMHMRQRVRG